jgi:hypothetical protein
MIVEALSAKHRLSFVGKPFGERPSLERFRVALSVEVTS